MREYVYPLLMLFLCRNQTIAQTEFRVNISGGLGMLFEASVANEVGGSYSGFGLERRINDFSIHLDYEKVSCFSNEILGINQIRLPGGDWMLAWYKGHIDLEQRDFAFDDIQLDPIILNAGRHNYVGSRQVFKSQSFILGVGYKLYAKGKFYLRPKLGLAMSINTSIATNISYTTNLDVTGKNFLLGIPTYTKYLYASAYLSIPITYQINRNMELSFVGSLYRAREIYLPLYGLSASVKLF